MDFQVEMTEEMLPVCSITALKGHSAAESLLVNDTTQGELWHERSTRPLLYCEIP